MGTTTEKLTYLNITKGKIKDSINLTGAGITNQDTFRSYASLLKTGLVSIINNGIDQLYSNFPKVSGTGSNLSLTPTYEAPMRNLPLGDTLQDGTPTPSSPIEIQTATGLQNVNITGKNLLDISQNLNSTNRGIDYILNNDGSITLNGTATATYSYVTGTVILNEPLKIGTYTYSIDHAISGQWRIIITYDDNTQETKAIMPGNTSITFTTTKKITKYYVSFSNITQDETYNETLFIQLEYGSTATEYEPYTSNTYEVNLGKNLSRIEDGTTTINGLTITVENGTITLNGTTTASCVFKLTNGLDTISDSRPNTNWFNENVVDKLAGKVLSINNISGSGPSSSWAIRLFKSTTTYSYQYTPSTFSGDKVYTSGDNISCICIFTNQNLTFDNYKIQIQLEKGTKSTSFSPYFTPIELNKINTYQDSIKKSTGKNLFSSEMELGSILGTGELQDNNNAIRTKDYISIQPNTTYTMQNNKNYSMNLYYWDINKSFLSSSSTTGTFTTPNNAYYMKTRTNASSTQNDLSTQYMLNEGATALTYEPYGKVWYLEKQIDKAVYTSSDIANAPRTYSNVKFFTIAKPTNSYMYNNYNRGNLLYTHAKEQITGGLDSADRINKISNVWPETLWIGFDTSTTLETAQQLLNNSVLYYPLASTQYITITNEELIEQLDNLYTAKSQDGTTNISITSEYLPMLLSASALKEED